MTNIPGTLLFNLKGHLVYYNHEATIYLPRLKERLKNPKLPPNLPKEILFLFEKTLNNLNHQRPARLGEVEQSFMPIKDGQLLLRSFPLGESSQDKPGSFIFLLIEPVSQEQEPTGGVNIPRATTVYELSHREVEVMQLICRGLTNKEIGETLFISDQTVKDHIKHIMSKMKVHSRTQIMATLLNLPKESAPE